MELERPLLTNWNSLELGHCGVLMHSVKLLRERPGFDLSAVLVFDYMKDVCLLQQSLEAGLSVPLGHRFCPARRVKAAQVELAGLYPAPFSICSRPRSA